MYRESQTLLLGLRRCAHCHGSGRQPEHSRCPACAGGGSSVNSHPRYCKKCGGLGLLQSRLRTEPCGLCAGTGVQSENGSSVVTPAVWDTLPIHVSREPAVVECLDHCSYITRRDVGHTGTTPDDDAALAAYVRQAVLASVDEVTDVVVDPNGAPTLIIADCLLLVVVSRRSFLLYAVWGSVPLPVRLPAAA